MPASAVQPSAASTIPRVALSAFNDTSVPDADTAVIDGSRDTVGAHIQGDGLHDRTTLLGSDRSQALTAPQAVRLLDKLAQRSSRVGYNEKWGSKYLYFIQRRR